MALILTVIFLLLAGPVGAAELILPDDWVTPCWEKAPNSSMYYPCAVDVLINKGWLEQRHLAWIKAAQQVQLRQQESCLAQMEAAMRTMEPYMVEMEGTNIWFVYKNINPDGFKPAKKLWNDAKRDCWRTP